MAIDDVDLDQFFEDDEDYGKGRKRKSTSNSRANNRKLSNTNKKHAIAEQTIAHGNRHAGAKAAGYDRAPRDEEFDEILTAKQQHYRKKLKIDPENVLKEYARLGFFDIKEMFDEFGNLKRISDLSSDVSTAITGLDVTTAEDGSHVVKFKLADKKGALDSLAKHLNLFEDHNKSKTEANAISDNERARRIAFVLAKGMTAKQTKPEKG